MKLFSTIFFVPLTAALPAAIPSALYTADQVTAITTHPNAEEAEKREASTIPQSDTYKRDQTTAARVTRDVEPTYHPKIHDKLSAMGLNNRDFGATADEDGVAAVNDAFPNTRYPGAAKIEAREIEAAKDLNANGKLPMRKRLVKIMKRGKYNKFCPSL